MAFVWNNHASLWDSPVACLRKSVSRIHGDVSDLPAFPTWGGEGQQQLAQGRCLSRHKPVHNVLDVLTQPLVKFWKQAPTVAAACAGAAAAAASMPIMKAALRIVNPRVPRPLSSPFAFLGYLYVVVFAFAPTEDLLLRSPTFRDTAARRDYLRFYNWFAHRTGMTITRDIHGVPHTTLVSTFLNNMGAERMSSAVLDRRPTAWQLFFPNLLHLDPLHLYFSVTSVWCIVSTPGYGQALFVGLLLGGGTLVNYLTWITARRTVRRLPVNDRNPVAINGMQTELGARRTKAWSAVTGNLRRGQLGGAWASFRLFVRCSCRYSVLHDLNPGLGASSGLAFIQGFVISFKPRDRLSIIHFVIGSTLNDLSQARWKYWIHALLVCEILKRQQSAAIAEFPSLKDILIPTLLRGFVALNLVRVLQWSLALSPRVGHQVHVFGSVAGVVFGVLFQLPRKLLA